MIRILILLLFSLSAAAQAPDIEAIYQNVRVIKFTNGLQGIYVYQPSYFTPVSNIDTFLYPIDNPTGTMRRVDLRLISWGDVFMDTTVSATATVLATSMVYTIYVDASGGNRTITINPYLNKQLINVKRIDNSSNTVTVQMNSGNIDGSATLPITGQNYNYALFWNGSTTRIQ